MDPEQLGEYLDEIAERLEGPAAAIYQAAVKQSYVIGIAQLLFVIFMAAVTWVSYKQFLKTREENNGKDRYAASDQYVFWAFAAGILGVGMVVGVVIFLFDGIPNIINPEWSAIRRIGYLVRGG